MGREFLHYYGKAGCEADYALAEKVLANAPGLQTALIEAAKIIKKNENEGAKFDECN